MDAIRDFLDSPNLPIYAAIAVFLALYVWRQRRTTPAAPQAAPAPDPGFNRRTAARVANALDVIGMNGLAGMFQAFADGEVDQAYKQAEDVIRRLREPTKMFEEFDKLLEALLDEGFADPRLRSRLLDTIERKKKQFSHE